jgi:hypothetical protein
METVREKTIEALNGYVTSTERREKLEMDDERIEVDVASKEILIKTDLYTYLSIGDMKLKTDLKEEALATLLYHLEADFERDSGPLLYFIGNFFETLYL